MTFANPGDIRIGLEAALGGGISDPRNVTIMKMFGLVDIGERAGSGIPDFINTWQKYVEFNPEYAISHNPDRTKLTIPYTIAALQKAGAKLAAQATNGVQVTNSDTSNTNSDTNNINDRAKIRDFINDRLRNKSNINDKGLVIDDVVDKLSITDDVVDKLVDIYCYLELNKSSKSDAIAKIISMSPSRTREYLQALIALNIVVPEGGNKNRTYSLKEK